jgi:hypothetical protein
MPVTQFNFQEKYRYQNGFASYHEYAPPPSVSTAIAESSPEQKQ